MFIGYFYLFFGFVRQLLRFVDAPACDTAVLNRLADTAANGLTILSTRMVQRKTRSFAELAFLAGEPEVNVKELKWLLMH